MRLLVVDDDEILRCLLVAQLSEAGHTVDECADGMAALSMITSKFYNAVICDWEMPRLDGPGLCRAVRAGPGGNAIYLIMLTGRDTAMAQAEGFHAGVDAFLVKPCDPVELLATLRTAQSIISLPKLKAS